MAQIMRDFDQEKIQECKEDIDTLLVFVSTSKSCTCFLHPSLNIGIKAGLFSAILSAFLVATYPNLQEDPSDKMLQVMERIAAQTSSYSLQSGVLNSTLASTPFAYTPFKPSPNDIRVNVLWFASLIISLITASFGILVKQWLREYMAVENPSPQARLRLRHVRYPELKRWKVFEIAAALPLLLQVALGLFFVGLCYLTASVHPSIAHTTLPLVIGWAICFIAVTLMPMLFPRCPFKTTFLKSALRFCHKHVANITPRLWRFFLACLADKIGGPASRFLDSLITMIDHAPLHMDHEFAAVVSTGADTHILAAVDAIQSNNELLGTTIRESLQQIQPSHAHIVLFVGEVLRNRSNAVTFVGMLPCITDMTMLPKTVVHIIRELIHPILEDTSFVITEFPYHISVLAIMLSPSQLQYTADEKDILHRILTTNTPNTLTHLARMCYSARDTAGCILTTEERQNKAGILLRGLTNAATALHLPLHIALECLETVLVTSINWPLSPYSRTPGSSCINCLRSSSDIFDNTRFAHDAAIYICTVIDDAMTSEGYETTVPTHLDHALTYFFNLHLRFSLRADTDQIFVEFFHEILQRTGESSAQPLVKAVLAMPLNWYESLKCRGFMQKAMDRTLPRTASGKGMSIRRGHGCAQLLTRERYSEAWPIIISRLKAAVEEHFQSFSSTIDALKLLVMFIRMVRLPESLQHRDEWRELLRVTAAPLDHSSVLTSASRTLALRCLIDIELAERRAAGCLQLDVENHFESMRGTRGQWASWYAPDKTVFDDTLVKKLGQFTMYRYVTDRDEVNEFLRANPPQESVLDNGPMEEPPADPQDIVLADEGVSLTRWRLDEHRISWVRSQPPVVVETSIEAEYTVSADVSQAGMYIQHRVIYCY